MIINEGTPDDRYFEWLYSLVALLNDRDPSQTYWDLFRKLYTTPFTYFVKNDVNRAEDGVELRYEFFGEEDLWPDDSSWRGLECSIFEMLIALARRAAFQSDDEPEQWFWVFLVNLELDRYTDDVYSTSIDEDVAEKLDTLNRRTYSEDGVGGLFPLRYPEQDQRRVELGYQLAAYLLEGG